MNIKQIKAIMRKRKQTERLKRTLYDHFCQVKSLLPSLRPLNVIGPRTPAFHLSKCGPTFCMPITGSR